MRRKLSAGFADFLKVWGTLILLVVAGFVVTCQFVGEPPPRVVRIATGAKNGAYYAFAQEYARLLARDGIELEVVSTAGSVENLKLLRRGEVSLALVQGGSAGAQDARQLQSLGSLFLEPLWIFTVGHKPVKRLSDLEGKRVAAGPEGSGTHLLSTQLLRAAGVSAANAVFVQLGSEDAVAALARGRIDAAFFVAAPQAPLIRNLVAQPGIELMDFDRAPAYARTFRFLTPVTLHEGVLDLKRNVPPRDLSLVAVSANLVARRDLHASLIPALLDTATRVHEEGSVLQGGPQFPSVELAELPLNEDARRYIVNGPSFLFRWLPYGTAVLLDRLKILVLPFLALLLPLFRVAPPLYVWQVRSKIYRWYDAVRDIDLRIQEQGEGRDSAALARELQELEREVTSISVPLAYTGELYHLRLHIALLQQKLATQVTRSEPSLRSKLVFTRAAGSGSPRPAFCQYLFL